jgi:hypothetical protein
VPVTPDSKDWTWVLERPCPECGVDTREIAPDAVAALTRQVARAWVEVLHRSDVGTRPDDATWSPLEYACHVRDVLRLYDVRLALMLEEDGPAFANWDQDETAVASRYGEQAPGTVAAELLAAGEAIAARFDTVGTDDWDRTGSRSDGARFTIATFARYFVHDPLHHLHDVGAPRPG